MKVICEGVGVIIAEIRVHAADRHIDLCHLPGVRVCLLPIDGKRPAPPAMGLKKFRALDEHAAAAAAWVINAAVLEGLQDFNQRPHDAARGIEFTAALAFLRGKLSDAVFIGPPQKILIVFRAFHVQIVGEQVHDLAQHFFVQVRAGIDLGKHALQRLVLILDGTHGVIQHFTDLRGVGVLRNILPAGGLRHKEDVVLHVGVGIVLKAVTFCDQLFIALFKGGGDVAQENQTDNDLPILRSRNRPPQNARRVPKLFLKSKVRLCIFRHVRFSFR